ncbi:hypothetical protein V8E53_005422 [Lactarius tabidus]
MQLWPGWLRLQSTGNPTSWRLFAEPIGPVDPFNRAAIGTLSGIVNKTSVSLIVGFDSQAVRYEREQGEDTTATVLQLEFESEKIHAPGQHDDSISSVLNLVIDTIVTGSWDRTVRFWGPRASTAQQSSQQLPERAYFMDTVSSRLVIALASRLFPHLRRAQNGHARADARELSEVSDSCPHTHVGRPRIHHGVR